MYRISAHAWRRICKRGLSAAELAAALDGICVASRNGTFVYGDPVTRCAVVVDEGQRVVLTAVRYDEAQWSSVFGERKKGRREWQRNRHR